MPGAAMVQRRPHSLELRASIRHTHGNENYAYPRRGSVRRASRRCEGAGSSIPEDIMKKLTLFLVLLIGFAPAWLSANDRVLLVARSYVGRKPISGLQFGCQGVVSKPTNLGGATEVDLPTGYSTGRQIKIDLIATRKAKGESWFLVNALVNIPAACESAALMLMRGSEMRRIGAEVRKTSTDAIQRLGEATAEQQRRALTDAAARRGLTFEQLQKAIDSFA